MEAEHQSAAIEPRWLLLAMGVCVIGGLFALLPKKSTTGDAVG